MHDPIRVQSYALVLLAQRATLKIKAASTYSEGISGYSTDELLELSLPDIFRPKEIREIEQSFSEQFPAVVRIKALPGWPAGKYQAIVHTVGEDLVVEIEPRRSWPHAGDYSARLNDFTRELEAEPTTSGLLQVLCDGLAFHFGYDRVVLLQFDDLNNGLVTHESTPTRLPSYLDFRFLEADVPAATRKNQLAETVFNYTDVAEPLRKVVGDLSDRVRVILCRHIAAREPDVHTAPFLKDSGLSTLGHLSLIIDGKLWGSVYLHSIEPILLDYQMRAFLRVAGRVAQQKIAYHIYHRGLRMEQAANAVRDRLQEEILHADHLVAGFTGGKTNILDLLSETHGAAICSEDELTLFGTTPTEAEVNAIMKWMKEDVGDQKLWCTDQLSGHHSPALSYTAVASGMLFLPLDPEANQWIIWFKPETTQQVIYGITTELTRGNDPRRFRAHENPSHHCSTAWKDDEIGTAQALQYFIQKVVLQRYSSTRRHNTLLREALEDVEVFSYTVGHDLRAPLRGIASFSDILQEDFGDVLGEEGNAHLDVIRQSAVRMRVFMDDLLALNRIDRRKVVVNSLSVSKLVKRVLDDLSTPEHGRPRCVVQKDIPNICGDRNYLLIVFTNLLSNAFKYSSREKEPRIEVGFTGEYRGGFPIFYVSDNGIGIPAEQHERIFDLFTRSPNSEGYEGTGIGLALVHRIIRFHDGEVWIESKPGLGTRFLFYTGVRPKK